MRVCESVTKLALLVLSACRVHELLQINGNFSQCEDTKRFLESFYDKCLKSILFAPSYTVSNPVTWVVHPDEQKPVDKERERVC